MSKIKNFEELKVWKDSVAVGVRVYHLCTQGKLAKDFGAMYQLRRSASSISNNIAEGFEYNSNKAFVKYLKYSKGSAGELRSNLFLLKEANMIEDTDYQALHRDLVGISSELEGFIQYLKRFEKQKPGANVNTGDLP